MEKKLVSAQFDLKWRDGLRGLILAIGTPVIYAVQELIPGWDIDPILKIAISAGLTYLLKNFFEPTKILEVNPSKAKLEQTKINNIEVN